MINVFYRDDFENSGEKNKRGSVDLDIFTVGVSTFLHASQTTNICDFSRLFQQRLPIII